MHRGDDIFLNQQMHIFFQMKPQFFPPVSSWRAEEIWYTNSSSYSSPEMINAYFIMSLSLPLCVAWTNQSNSRLTRAQKMKCHG